MHTGDAIPRVREDTSLRDALLEMTAKRLGMTAVVDGRAGSPACSPTATCAAPWTGAWISTPPHGEVMTRNPRTIRPGILAAEALQVMDSKKINGLIVVNATGTRRRPQHARPAARRRGVVL
jgi:arabinose-5-phosphate isomerase